VLKHPVSAFIRLLPALLWLVALGYTLSVVRAVLFAPREAERTALDFAFALGLLAVAIYAGIQMFREYKRVLPALRADTSVWTGLFPRRPKPIPRQRHPLTEPLRAKLRELVDALETAGILQPEEVVHEQIVECAEMDDDYTTIDTDDVIRILRSVEYERGHPFANLTFFIDQCEYRAEDAVGMVREFARLSGKSASIGAVVRVKGIDGGEVVPAGRASFPPHNARVDLVRHVSQELAARSDARARESICAGGRSRVRERRLRRRHDAFLPRPDESRRAEPGPINRVRPFRGAGIVGGKAG
jgi:hypothetical protein